MEPTTARFANPPGEPAPVPAAREIVRTPGTCWGKPRLEGTRIKVEQVVIWHDRMGLSPAEIVAQWPHLTTADVRSALDFYRDHREEIDAGLADGDKRFEDLKATQPSILEKLRRRTADAPDDQVPPR